jgi:hypothetical protein
VNLASFSQSPQKQSWYTTAHSDNWSFPKKKKKKKRKPRKVKSVVQTASIAPSLTKTDRDPVNVTILDLSFYETVRDTLSNSRLIM